uniref:Shikimate kinase n=1 Tax=Acidobacterium capsulatum TaxID=33075 RepID=A0A7V4XR40_9BACT
MLKSMQSSSSFATAGSESTADGAQASGLRAVVLTGFMGAGKTTLGRLLATDLGWEFRDLDAEIEQDSGMTVADIFRAEGEAGFRAREVAMLGRLLQGERLVLALGGGAVESAGVRDHLTACPGACVVYLAAPLEALVQRCLQQPGAAERPVLADRERLQARWTARVPYYEQAHLKVETAGARPEETLQTLRTLLEKQTVSASRPGTPHE